MSKRDVIKIADKHHYAERNKKGEFDDITNIGDSIHSDLKDLSAGTVKPGHGHEGDLKKKRNRKK